MDEDDSLNIFGSKYREFYKINYGRDPQECLIKVQVKKISDYDSVNSTVLVNYVLVLDWTDYSLRNQGNLQKDHCKKFR